VIIEQSQGLCGYLTEKVDYADVTLCCLSVRFVEAIDTTGV
jgi:hypothetical protein